ncbi:MAG: transcription termination factor Rho [Acidobacteria bacterium]|nr:MAG: transcription termination factor Rho [Acidobacteriota bacterium]
MDLHELEHKTVNDLREMAGKYEDIEGATGLKKEQLLELLCEKLGIDRQTHVPEGIGRRKIKADIRDLRRKRDEALEKHDSVALAAVRGAIKSRKRHLRRQISAALRKAAAKPQAVKEAPAS